MKKNMTDGLMKLQSSQDIHMATLKNAAEEAERRAEPGRLDAVAELNSARQKAEESDQERIRAEELRQHAHQEAASAAMKLGEA